MKNGVIRVAQIIGFAAEGGVESMAMNLYLGIDREKVQFDFFVECTSKIIREDKIKELGGNVVIIPPIKEIIFDDSKLVSLLKKGNYDIVHANKSTLNYFYLRAAKKAGIKVRISHAHSTTSRHELFKNLAKSILRFLSKKYATHLFACSEKAGIWNYGKKAFLKGEVHVVNNAIDVEKYKFNPLISSEMREELHIKNKYVIGHVGRFMKQKNHKYIVKIFKRVHDIDNDTVLLLVGDGPLLNSIRALVVKKHLDSFVIFAGTHKHPERYYQAMDCLLMPSLYEGLPVVGVEAQTNGLNCFFSTTVTREVVINDNCYFRSLKDNPDKWALSILSKKERMSADRESKYINLLNSKFNIKNEAKALTDFYCCLING